MKAHVLNSDNVIINTISVESLDFMSGLIAASNGGAIGDIWDGVEFIKNKIQTSLDSKLDQLAALRYEKETAGVEINGTRIRTDRETQSILDSAQRKAESDPYLVVDWKGENEWVELTSPQIIAIGNAVFAHVQACFKRERELSELLDVDIETDITTGWPI